MSSTTFVDQVTPIVSSWLNDINNTTYNVLGSAGVPPANAAAVVANLGILTTSIATTTYLTQTNATATYLTQANAALTYLGIGATAANSSLLGGLSPSSYANSPTTSAAANLYNCQYLGGL